MLNKIIILVILCLLKSNWCLAFDNKQTHRQLTDKAIVESKTLKTIYSMLGFAEEYQTILNNGENDYSILEWFQEGSEKEDDPACRASNHFHNPNLSWSEAQLTDEIFIVDAWCSLTSPFREKYSNLVWATGIIAQDQTPISPPVNCFVNDEVDKKAKPRNWAVARDYFYWSLTESAPYKRGSYLAETLYTLGYTLHLLQDMAVPAHTRNDFSIGHTQIADWPWKHGWIGNPFETLSTPSGFPRPVLFTHPFPLMRNG